MSTTLVRSRRQDVGRLPATFLVTACGFFLISLSYAGGRDAAPWAHAVFWCGQVLLFGPVVVRLLYSRRISDREALGSALVVAVLNYGTEYCYRPLQFRFPDELQHWRTAQDMLATHHLFTVNYSLPISPRYPGLENATVALAALTGTSIFVAGLIVIGVARVLLTLGLYLLFRHISGSVRIAGLASVLFTTTFYYKSLLAMFIYMTMALPFLVLTIYAAVRLTDGWLARTSRLWWVVGIVSVLVTVVTHHVTSYILILALALASIVCLVNRGTRARALPLVILTATSVAGACVWAAIVAPEVVGYLRPSITDLLGGLSIFTSGHTPTNGGTLQSPIVDSALSYVGVAVMSVGIPVGCYGIWRDQRQNIWALTVAATSVSLYVLLLVRVVSTNGAEYSGTALAYASIPISYVLAESSTVLASGIARPRLAVASCATLATLVLLGGITSGWPPYWERLPGRKLVSGFESSVTPEGVATARWTLRHLHKGNRFVADQENYTLLGTYGRQDAVRGLASLYYSSRFRASDRRLVANDAVRYVLVDRRLGRQLPASGAYFPDDPRSGRHRSPIPMADLTKFDRIAGTLRVYDSGNIVIYDLKGSRYAP